MLSRVGNGVDDVASCTSSPAAVWLVPLVTVPIRFTVAPGVAYCGFIELMVTETRPAQHHDGRGHHRRDGEDRSHGQYPPLDLGRQHAVHTLNVIAVRAGAVLSIMSVAVPMNNEQRKAAAALMRARVPEVAEIGRPVAAP